MLTERTTFLMPNTSQAAAKTSMHSFLVENAQWNEHPQIESHLARRYFLPHNAAHGMAKDDHCWVVQDGHQGFR